MTLPASGTISLSQVNTELGYSSSAAVSLNQADVRNLAGKASGLISMSDLYGKSSGISLIWNGAPVKLGVTALGVVASQQYTLPGSVQEGDLLVVSGAGYAVYLKNSSGWEIGFTTLVSYASVKYNVFVTARRINNVDIARGYINLWSLDNTAPPGGFTARPMVWRASGPWSTISSGSWTYTSGNNTTAPANYTISASGQGTPILLLGYVDANSSTAGTNMTLSQSPVFDYVSSDAGNGVGQMAYKLYNGGTPVNHVMSAPAPGNSATLKYSFGGWIKFNPLASGKSAGVKIFNTSGSWSFTVPDYATNFIIKINGGGGGGGGGGPGATAGAAGTATTCTNLSWTAGGGGAGAANNGNGGAGGTNTGTADTSTTGGAGSKPSTSLAGGGGGSSLFDPATTGGASGVNSIDSYGGSGGLGGGSGGTSVEGSGGGAGGFMKKTYAAGGIAPGTVLSGTIGTGGNGGTGPGPGVKGQDGLVYLEWY